MDRIIKIIKECIAVHFWGEVTIRFQAGIPVVVVKSEQIKIEGK
jgi:hypothetical protein